jgi:hypothetical protein
MYAAERSDMSQRHDPFGRVREFGLQLAGIVEGTSYGTAALRVGKKLLCRMKDDPDTLVLMLGSMDEKELLMAEEPERFFETPHYVGWPVVLLRLSKTSDERLRELLTENWRRLATARMRATQDGGTAPRSARPAKAARPRTRVSRSRPPSGPSSGQR